MFGHLPELFIVLVIALIVFGPEKLPEVAANAGKMMREVRQVIDVAMNPEEHAPDDFSTYYYESLARAEEDVPVAEEPYPPEDEEYLLKHDHPEAAPSEHAPENEASVRVSGSVQADQPEAAARNGKQPEIGQAQE